jgi:hypothetical protein
VDEEKEKIAMSTSLQIYRAKPNPAGKDRSVHGPKPEQLIAEWADIKNTGNETISFGSVDLHHTKFGRTCAEIHGSESYWKGASNEFAPGQVLRVHTGSRRYENLLSEEDKGSVDWRAFAERSNFVLNNVCGDMISVFWVNEFKQWIHDSASYDPNPPEGVILYRRGSKLQPIGVGLY